MNAVLGLIFLRLGALDWAEFNAVDVGGIGELRAFEITGDDASATANIEECVGLRDEGVDDAVVSKGEEGEVLLVEMGVFCWLGVKKQSVRGFKGHGVTE